MTTRSWRVSTWMGSFVIQSPGSPPSADDQRKAEAMLFTLLATPGAHRDVLNAVHAALFRPLGSRGRAAAPDAATLERDLRAAARVGTISIAPVAARRVRVENTAPAAAPTTGAEPATDEVVGDFIVVFLDEVGDPISGLDIVIKFLGQRHPLKTDGSGRARVDGVTASFASVEISDTKQLHDILKPRFSTPRDPNIPEGEHVQQQTLDKNFDSVPIESGIEETVVITPRFACREIPATTFAFARSFVQREGIQHMAEIAEELHQDDGQLAWIFGHTDTSGSDQLNKRLSERRARAVFALFTHDFALWDEMWNAKTQESPWWEKWGTREMQHMLNTLGCTNDEGQALEEDGQFGDNSRQALNSFQAGKYPDKPAEQAALVVGSGFTEPTRKELFFAYAKRISRDPVATDRIAKIGSASFMGCGEFNPLSLAAKDEKSRRTVIFIFDPASQPKAPPCVIGDVKPCQLVKLSPAPTADQEPPFYSCSFYKSFADCCPKEGGPDLSHDVIVRFLMTLSEANQLPHEFILEAEDEAEDEAPFEVRQTLAADARALTEEQVEPGVEADRLVELHFTHVPDAHKYRMRVEGVSEPYDVFRHIAFHAISDLSSPIDGPRFPSLIGMLDPPVVADAGVA